jgi:hypothetical protein
MSVDREDALNARPATGPRRDAKLRADGSQPVAYWLKRPRAYGRRIEAAAIVAYLDLEAPPLGRQPHVRPLGIGVLHHVRQPFEHEEVRRRFERGIEPP